MDHKEFRALLKDLSFPGGQNVSRFTDGTSTHSAVWSKRAGHAGRAVVDRVIMAAKEAGFKEAATSSFSDATGDRVGFDSALVKGDVTIKRDVYYGETARYNRFRVSIVCKPAKIVVD